MISFSFSSSSELFRKVLGHFILLGVKYNAKQIVALRGIHLNFSRNKVRPTECTRHDFIDGVSTSPSSFSLLNKLLLTTFGKNPAIRTFSYLLSRSKLSIFVSQITTSAGNNRARGTRQFWNAHGGHVCLQLARGSDRARYRLFLSRVISLRVSWNPFSARSKKSLSSLLNTNFLMPLL